MTDDRYRLVLTRTAARAISPWLPEAVAAAVVELLERDLRTHPQRVGKPPQRELAGVWSARRGTYRVLYDIDDDQRTIRVMDVSARRDAYRRR